jgi:hypothetical protein
VGSLAYVSGHGPVKPDKTQSSRPPGGVNHSGHAAQ